MKVVPSFVTLICGLFIIVLRSIDQRYDFHGLFVTVFSKEMISEKVTFMLFAFKQIKVTFSP